MILNKYQREYYHRERARVLERQRLYYQRNKERISEREKHRRSKPSWKRLNRLRYQKEKHRRLPAARAYYYAHRDKILKQRKEKPYGRTPEQKAKRRRYLEKYYSSPKNRQRRQHMNREYRRVHPENARRQWLKTRYGLSLSAYDTLFQKQCGVCAICGKDNAHPTRWGTVSRRLVVDHCHKTKKVRGLLCHHCNAGMGHFSDDPKLLSKAAAYLTGT